MQDRHLCGNSLRLLRPGDRRRGDRLRIHRWKLETANWNPRPSSPPGSRNAVRLSQLKRWAKQTAGEIAKERGIARVEFDADLEATLKEQDEQR